MFPSLQSLFPPTYSTSLLPHPILVSSVSAIEVLHPTTDSSCRPQNHSAHNPVINKAVAAIGLRETTGGSGEEIADKPDDHPVRALPVRVTIIQNGKEYVGNMGSLQKKHSGYFDAQRMEYGS